jgi:hypothetical protein
MPLVSCPGKPGSVEYCLYAPRGACCPTGRAPVACADVPRSQVAAVCASQHCKGLLRAFEHANCTAGYGGRGQAGKPCSLRRNDGGPLFRGKTPWKVTLFFWPQKNPGKEPRCFVRRVTSTAERHSAMTVPYQDPTTQPELSPHAPGGTTTALVPTGYGPPEPSRMAGPDEQGAGPAALPCIEPHGPESCPTCGRPYGRFSLRASGVLDTLHLAKDVIRDAIAQVEEEVFP